MRWLDWRAECRPPFQTALRFVGGVIAVIGYATLGSRAEFLWLASFGLVIKWFGDLLDGIVARLRQMRPRYGYYLGNSVD